MNRIDFFRQQVRDSRDFLEGTVQDVTPEQALWTPLGRAMPIAGHYAHVVAAQDMGLHAFVLGTPPLAVGAWAGRTGMQELPPPFGHAWDGWARQAFEIESLRNYAAAVYAANDTALASLAESDLDRVVDLTAAGFGEQTLAFVLVNGWVTNVNLHCGEISNLKGLQEAKGYPV